MRGDPSGQTASTIMGDIQSTLTGFHEQCEQWEREVDQYLEELQEFVPVSTVSAPESDPASSGRVADELAELRQMVERQTEWFGRLFESARRGMQPADPVVAEVLQKLHALQPVSA